MPAAFRIPRAHRRLLRLFVAATAFALGGVRAAPPSLTDAPILNFRLSLFDDETGRKTSDLRGGTALYHSAEEIELRDFTLTLLDRRDVIALKVVSPQALLEVKTRAALGDNGIRVEGPGYSLLGQRWRCDEPTRKVAIRDEAKVVFQAPLIDILK